MDLPPWLKARRLSVTLFRKEFWWPSAAGDQCQQDLGDKICGVARWNHDDQAQGHRFKEA